MAEIKSTATAVFLDKLRAQTRPQHEALEQIPQSKNLISPSLTDKQYSEYLSRLYPVVKWFESAIFPQLSQLVPDLEERRKEPILRADLYSMGVETEQLAEFSFGPGTVSLSEAMGMMYVMEGSTLGGKFIAANVQNSLGRNAANGAAYFSVYGDSLGRKWKDFLNTFVNFVADEGGEESVIRGASSMFDAMKEWMQNE